eukprot:jgi/Mesvir1/2868/Mv13951-RA.2
MDDILKQLDSKEPRVRQNGVNALQQFVELESITFPPNHVKALVDASFMLLKETNFRITQGFLLAFAAALPKIGDAISRYIQSLIAPVIDKLGDSKQPVREATRRFLISLMEVLGVAPVLEKAGGYGWEHKNWHVRDEYARMTAEAIGLARTQALPYQKLILPSVIKILEDSNSNVREAAMLCLEAMYRRGQMPFRDHLAKYPIRPAQMKEISTRFDAITLEEAPLDVEGYESSSLQLALVPSPGANGGPRPRSSSVMSGRMSVSGGKNPDREIFTECDNAPPVRVYSEKDLSREVDKIIGDMNPKMEWTVRIAALQRMEGLMHGGAAEYPSFLSLLSKLKDALGVQVVDRRSAILKQACHLLNTFAKALGNDFSSFADYFVPMLIKLTAITVQIMADSADHCVKTIIDNCRGIRLVAKVADLAMTSRANIIRAKSAEYCLRMLEVWGCDADVQKNVDTFEQVIKAAVGDAAVETRATGRRMYMVFAGVWPERGRRLIHKFDAQTQKMIYEDGYVAPDGAEPMTPPAQSRTPTIARDRPSTAAKGESTTPTKAGGRVPKRSSFGGFSTEMQEAAAAAREMAAAAMREAPPTLGQPAGTSGPTLRKATVSGGAQRVDLPYARGEEEAGAEVDRGTGTAWGASNTVAGAKASRVARRSSSVNPDTGPPSVGGAKRVPRDDTSANAGTDGNVSTSSSQPVGSATVRRASTARARVPSRQSSFTTSEFGGAAEDQLAGEEDMPLSSILAVSSLPVTNWQARVKAFESMRLLLRQPKGQQDIRHSIDKVVVMYMDNLGEAPHHRVVQAALTALGELFPVCVAQMENTLERLFPILFANLVDAKETIRKKASNVLMEISGLFGPEAITAGLLRSLDVHKVAKARTGILEFALHCLMLRNEEDSAVAGACLQGTALLRHWVSKILPFIHDKNLELRKAAIANVALIYDRIDAGTVHNAVSALAFREQTAAIKQLSASIVNFDALAASQTRRFGGTRAPPEEEPARPAWPKGPVASLSMDVATTTPHMLRTGSNKGRFTSPSHSPHPHTASVFSTPSGLDESGGSTHSHREGRMRSPRDSRPLRRDTSPSSAAVLLSSAPSGKRNPLATPVSASTAASLSSAAAAATAAVLASMEGMLSPTQRSALATGGGGADGVTVAPPVQPSTWSSPDVVAAANAASIADRVADGGVHAMAGAAALDKFKDPTTPPPIKTQVTRPGQQPSTAQAQPTPPQKQAQPQQPQPVSQLRAPLAHASSAPSTVLSSASTATPQPAKKMTPATATQPSPQQTVTSSRPSTTGTAPATATVFLPTSVNGPAAADSGGKQPASAVPGHQVVRVTGSVPAAVPSPAAAAAPAQRVAPASSATRERDATSGVLASATIKAAVSRRSIGSTGSVPGGYAGDGDESLESLVDRLRGQLGGAGAGGSVGAQLDALKEIVHLSRLDNKALWVNYFAEILSMVTDAFASPHAEVRELALVTVKEMETCQVSTTWPGGVCR